LIERWESTEAMQRFHERPEFTSLERTLEGSPQVEIFTTA
jgi:quinol monooxygenase YgiN